MDFDEDRSNIWLIYNENGERKCVMTAKKSESNWLREVCPAESAAIANVLAISHRYVKSFLACLNQNSGIILSSEVGK